MSKLTIQEALAEIKTIAKRIESKEHFVRTYLWRQKMLADPLEDKGGSPEAIARERQAIFDLNDRRVLIRRLIQQANEYTPVVVEGVPRSIAEWLVWRREVAPGHKRFLEAMAAIVESVRDTAAEKKARVFNAVAMAANVADVKPIDAIVNIDEQELAQEREKLEKILGTLDGQLSLKNATVTIELPD